MYKILENVFLQLLYEHVFCQDRLGAIHVVSTYASKEEWSSALRMKIVLLTQLRHDFCVQGGCEIQKFVRAY